MSRRGSQTAASISFKHSLCSSCGKSKYALADMSARLRRDGIIALEDLRGISMEVLQEEVSALNLKQNHQR
jgi:hypothetical protein